MAQRVEMISPDDPDGRSIAVDMMCFSIDGEWRGIDVAAKHLATPLGALNTSLDAARRSSGRRLKAG